MARGLVLSGPHGLDGSLPISLMAPYSHHINSEPSVAIVMLYDKMHFENVLK